MDQLERPIGPLKRQEEVQHVSENEGYIPDHQYDFYNDPHNRCMYGEELQKFHNKDNLLLGFVNINGLKEEIRKGKNI